MDWKRTFTTACWVRLYHVQEFFVTLFRYYLAHPKFFLADLLILGYYFFKSPYRLVREFDEQHPDHPIGPYGETEFRAFETLLSQFDISRDRSLADLGAGRCRLGFWLALVRKQKFVLAVERHGRMAAWAQIVASWLHISSLVVEQGDWHRVPLNGIDVIYLYGYMSDLALRNMAFRLSLLPKGTQIITISSWLGEVMPGAFVLEKKAPIRFVWGETEAFLQRIP